MITNTEKQLLLDFQRARFALDAFSEVDKARSVYEQAKENLKKITDPVAAELVRRMSQERTYDVTPDSCSINVERAEDILFAEKALYEMTWQYGDNTNPNGTATGMIQ